MTSWQDVAGTSKVMLTLKFYFSTLSAFSKNKSGYHFFFCRSRIHDNTAELLFHFNVPSRRQQHTKASRKVAKFPSEIVQHKKNAAHLNHHAYKS